MTRRFLPGLGRRIASALGRLLACGLALGSLGVAGAQNPLAVTTSAFIVEPDGRLVQATTVLPGQVIEYQLTVANLGDSVLPSGTVEVVGLVPDGTVFVAGSATPTSERLLTEYSATDGEAFAETPLRPDGAAVDPSGYRAVRWILQVPFGPNARTAMSYRVMMSNPSERP